VSDVPDNPAPETPKAPKHRRHGARGRPREYVWSWEVFEGLLLSGVTLRELARTMHCSEATIRSRLAEARQLHGPQWPIGRDEAVRAYKQAKREGKTGVPPAASKRGVQHALGLAPAKQAAPAASTSAIPTDELQPDALERTAWHTLHRACHGDGDQVTVAAARAILQALRERPASSDAKQPDLAPVHELRDKLRVQLERANASAKPAESEMSDTREEPKPAPSRAPNIPHIVVPLSRTVA
jgi:hypothetical protein